MHRGHLGCCAMPARAFPHGTLSMSSMFDVRERCGCVLGTRIRELEGDANADGVGFINLASRTLV